MLCNLFRSTQPNDQETVIGVKRGGSLLKDLESCKGILQLSCKILVNTNTISLLKKEVWISVNTDTPALLQVTLKLAADYY